jgi:phosphoribosylaminoimidazolecarboxamide formyltransferase/IMP cyclohydrolase
MSIKTAIISVFDKQNLNKLIPFLEDNNYIIYSTGGTKKEILKYVKDEKHVISISDYTESPEICNGRVKTLHPKIFGGLLGERKNKSHISDIIKIGGIFFDLVVVNLYPFEQVLKNNPENENILLENIDIGGHTLLRAAIKNYKFVDVLSEPSQYDMFIQNRTKKKDLAKYAMSKIMKYDIAINNWFNVEKETIGVSYDKIKEMKYGLNPYMKPSNIYKKNEQPIPFEVLNGNPGYINLLDVQYAIRLVTEVKSQLNIDCCASFKHNSPAGVAIGKIPASTFKMARGIDPKSSFGDVISYSGIVNKNMALLLKKCVSDGIVAFDYTSEALSILKQKKKGNYLILKQQNIHNGIEFRDVNGVTLTQPTNDSILSREKLTNVPINIQNDMILGYITLKYTQSNCVCYVYEGKVIGIGSGQQNRVDCVKLAGEKAKLWFNNNLYMPNHLLKIKNLVLVSDAFFPFADNIEVAAEYKVQYILQPGGSIRDKEVKDACEKYNIKMICSNQRVFTH